MGRLRPEFGEGVAGTSDGRIPANVSENARANVTAGFAKDVDAVNHRRNVSRDCERNRRWSTPRAPPDHREKSKGRQEFAEHLCEPGSCARRQHEHAFLENITCAAKTPRTPTRTAREHSRALRARGDRLAKASAMVTAGLRSAPETGPNVRINATSAAPVARRVREQGDRLITGRQSLRHNAGSDDRGEQHRRADGLCDEPPLTIDIHRASHADRSTSRPSACS